MTKAEKTRQFIIESTAPLFNKKGFQGTSMSDITRATGLTKGSVYGNFKNKDELAIETFRYNRFLLTREISQSLKDHMHTVDKLLVFTEFYRHNFIDLFKKGGCAILNTGVDADDCHTGLKEEVKQALNSWKALIENILKDGMSKGEIKKIQSDEFSSFFLAIVEGSIFVAKTTGSSSVMTHNLNLLETEIKKLKY